MEKHAVAYPNRMIVNGTRLRKRSISKESAIRGLQFEGAAVTLAARTQSGAAFEKLGKRLVGERMRMKGVSVARASL